jgi:hypothetical protein
MAVVTLVVPAPSDRVWAVLRDGWTYSDWVVGSAHIRDVDAAWPAPGARLHHKVGPWPVSVRDTSTVLACDEPRELRLRAGLWPFGAATVEIRLRAVGAGATEVSIAEQFTHGPLLAVRNKLSDLVLHRRNKESLRRLADIATREKAAPDLA